MLLAVVDVVHFFYYDRIFALLGLLVLTSQNGRKPPTPPQIEPEKSISTIALHRSQLVNIHEMHHRTNKKKYSYPKNKIYLYTRVRGVERRRRQRTIWKMNVNN